MQRKSYSVPDVVRLDYTNGTKFLQQPIHPEISEKKISSDNNVYQNIDKFNGSNNCEKSAKAAEDMVEYKTEHNATLNTDNLVCLKQERAFDMVDMVDNVLRKATLSTYDDNICIFDQIAFERSDVNTDNLLAHDLANIYDSIGVDSLLEHKVNVVKEHDNSYDSINLNASISLNNSVNGANHKLDQSYDSIYSEIFVNNDLGIWKEKNNNMHDHTYDTVFSDSGNLNISTNHNQPQSDGLQQGLNSSKISNLEVETEMLRCRSLNPPIQPPNYEEARRR